MAQFDAQVATAKRLIKKFGQQATFSGNQPGASDGPAGTVTQGASVSITGYGVALDYTIAEIDDKAILRSDIKFLFEPGVGVPAIGYTVTVNGTAHRVMNVKPLSPSGQDIIYTVQLRV